MRNIVCISGTSRPGNYTSRALAVVISELKSRGEKLTTLDARELDLRFPGHGETADSKRLVEAVEKASGIVLAGPEYHGGISAMTKLIIENMGFPSKLAGKPVALVGVAAGRIGAIKSLEQLKGICSHTGAIVVPGSVSIAGIQQVFDDDGNCLDENTERALKGVAAAMTGFLDNFVCPKFALEEMVRSGERPWTTTV